METEHAIGSGADAVAVCFVEIHTKNARSVFGVGMHRNIVTASLNAIISAVNRAEARHMHAIARPTSYRTAK